MEPEMTIVNRTLEARRRSLSPGKLNLGHDIIVITFRGGGVIAMEQLTGDDPAEVGGYRLVARLGRGGMGRVYLAVTDAGRPVALKVMRPEFGEDREFRARFRQEVDAARRVHGFYTAQVLDADPDASPPWLVTAYVAGPSLAEAVTRHGPLPADTVLMMMAGVAEALRAIHAAGVVHRDLKPSNVLLAADGPRVIDFGIARAAEATPVTRTGIGLGSPAFMAPEQAAGLPVSPATDVFSLGSTAAYAAVGRTPFGEGNTAAMLYRVVHTEPDLSGCPPQLSDVIGSCLAKDAAQRPSPAEIITRCRAYTAGLTPQAWLPAEVAAGMAQHAPPASVTAAPVLPTAILTSPVLGPAAAQPGNAAHGIRRRVLRWPLIAGLAALIVAVAAGAGVTALVTPGHDSPGTAVAGATDTPQRSLAATTRPSTSPSSSPSPGSCLIGTWKMVNQQVTNIVNGEPAQFSGPGGATIIMRPDGTTTTDYGSGSTLSADVNGVEWTETVTGTLTSDWTAQNGQLLFSDVTAHGTQTLRADGVIDVQSPLTPANLNRQYTCSGNTLREYAADASAVLTRQSTGS
jgi:hypothetical protein